MARRTVRIRGEALRDIRERRGVSPTRLARSINRSRSAIVKFENGTHPRADVSFAWQIANFLGVDLSEFTETGDEQEPDRALRAAS